MKWGEKVNWSDIVHMVVQLCKLVATELWHGYKLVSIQLYHGYKQVVIQLWHGYKQVCVYAREV